MSMNKTPLKKNEVYNLLKKIKKPFLNSEKVSLFNAEGRFLSSDIFSSINLPPFNNSAVDGYAIRDDNLKTKKLLCAYKITAGDKQEIFLKHNESSRIFTG